MDRLRTTRVGLFWLEGSAKDNQSVVIATVIGGGHAGYCGRYMGRLRTTKNAICGHWDSPRTHRVL